MVQENQEMESLDMESITFESEGGAKKINNFSSSTKQKESNFFSLRKRKMKGTIAPLFSCKYLCLTIYSALLVLLTNKLTENRILGI